MKKIVIILLAMISFSAVSAQEINWGVKAGANLSGTYGTSDSESKVNFTGGLFAELKTKEWLGLGLEMLYSSEGYKEIPDGGGKRNRNLSYLNVPILANFYLGKERCFSIKAGVQPGFLLGANLFKDDFKTFALAVPVGIAYEFDCGLLFDLRYNFGVTNINKLSYRDYSSVLALTAGWKF